MPKPRRPHQASPDEVKLIRDGDTVIIAYADESVATTHLKMGRDRLAEMTDEQILDFWNEGIAAREDFVAEQEYVAIEIPIGRAQLKYEKRSDQWVPRGSVVKGSFLGADGTDLNDPFATVDGQDLTVREFVRMTNVFAGWGFRLVFVGDEDIHDEPEIEVREPSDE